MRTIDSTAPDPGDAATAEFERHASCELLAREWDQLAIETGASPFVRPGWIAAWWDAFGEGDLEIFAMRREGRLCGVLPMARRGSVLASPTNWHTPDFDAVVADEPAATKLLGRVLEHDPRRVDLHFLDPHGAAIGGAAQLGQERPVHQRVLERSPYITLEGDWDAYLSGLPSKLRGHVRRAKRRLENDGKLEFELHDGSKDLEALLTEGFLVEASGWKGEMGTAINSRPETDRFYREIAEWAAGLGLLRLAMLRVDGRVIAFQFAIQDERSYYLLKPGYDDRLKKLGPGNILLFETIGHSFADGLKSFEFLGADDPHKLRYTSTCRERLHAQLFARTVRGRVDRLFQTRAKSAARWLRQRVRR